MWYIYTMDYHTGNEREREREKRKGRERGRERGRQGRRKKGNERNPHPF